MTQFSFQRLDDGTWGVKASGNLDQAAKYAGQTVDVSKRDGSIQSVTLGHLVTQWNGGRAATYTKVASPRQMTRFAAPSGARAALRNIVSAMDDDAVDDDFEAEYDDFAAAAYAAERITQVQAAMAVAEVLGSKQEAWYDVTSLRIKTDVPAAEVLRVLNRHAGQDAMAYGKFGGYTTYSHAVQTEPGVVEVEALYHIGD